MRVISEGSIPRHVLAEAHCGFCNTRFEYNTETEMSAACITNKEGEQTFAVKCPICSKSVLVVVEGKKTYAGWISRRKKK